MWSHINNWNNHFISKKSMMKYHKSRNRKWIMLVINVTAKQYKSNKSRFTNSQNMMIWSILVTSVTTKQHTWTHWTFIHNKNTKEFSLIVTNLATRQPGKRYWKNTSNPNMRGSSTSVTSVTTNHRLSNNLRFISTQTMREL